MDNCIFCKILEGKIPSAKIYEDANTFAFLDINPCNKGHSLVITKNHYETLNDIPEKELTNLISSVQKVAKAVLSATSCHGYNILMNNKKAAGQVVPHVHFHIIPRVEKDNVIPAWKTTKYSESEMDEYKKMIAKRIS
jgi:histidine triad (HIT) family protein